MNSRDEHFRRIDSRVNRAVIEGRRVLIAGVGQMGSQLAWLLAQHGVRYIALFDGDRLELHNLVRHLLPASFVGTNKSEGTASWLRLNIPGVEAMGVPRALDESMTDLEIDGVLRDVDVLVVATDNLVAQRRLSRRARAMGIIAVVPGLYPDDGGGEVFVELGFEVGCTECWYDFRPRDARLRNAAVTPAQDHAVIQYATYLILAVLDPGSPWSEELAPEPGRDRPPQLFLLRDGAAVRRAVVTPRPGCAGCRVAPSTLNPGPEGRPVATDFWTSHDIQTHARPPEAGWPFTLDGHLGTPRIDALNVSARAVASGAPVVVAWHTTNATRVELDGTAYPPTGSAQLLVKDSHAFQLRAINPFGEVLAETQWVRAITPPRVKTLTIAPVPAPVAARFAPRLATASRLPIVSAPRIARVRPGSPAFPRAAAPMPPWSWHLAHGRKTR